MDLLTEPKKWILILFFAYLQNVTYKMEIKYNCWLMWIDGDDINSNIP